MPIVLNGSTGNISASSLTGVTTGKVLQLQQVLKTDAFSTSSTSFVDITGLSVNITPSSSSNKVLVDFVVACGNDAQTQNRFELVREVSSTVTPINPNAMDSSTAMFYVAANSNLDNYTRAQVTYRFLDSPNTTSQVNYRVRTKIYSSSVTQYVNRAAYNSNTTGSSVITAMEVAA
jgi:trehalose-6-phosphatase